MSRAKDEIDSVRIFVTWPSDDGNQTTRSYESGTGNFYAQLGQVAEWLSMQEEFQRDHARKLSNKDDDD